MKRSKDYLRKIRSRSRIIRSLYRNREKLFRALDAAKKLYQRRG